MLIHAIMPESRANGPGLRAVVWTQGCLLRCPGCHNRNTHAFRGDAMKPIDICRAIWNTHPLLEGLTVSGGEPMHQAAELLRLFEQFRAWWPAPSLRTCRTATIGMFTGYTLEELEAGDYFCLTWPIRAQKAARAELWQKIRAHLDWAVLGRYDMTLASDLPLRSSSNQQLVLFTDRQTEADFGDAQLVEFEISESGLVRETGLPRSSP